MKKTFYKWFKQPVDGTRVEVTKDYFSDGDEYINEINGWVKLHDKKLVLEDDKDDTYKKK